MSTTSGDRKLKDRKLRTSSRDVYSQPGQKSGTPQVRERAKTIAPGKKSRKVATKPPTPKYLQWIKRHPLRPIESEKQNEIALEIFDELMTLNIANKLSADESAYYSVLSTLIGEFEDKTYDLGSEPSGAEMLEFMMEQHDLRQIDLVKELGSQTTVSFILTGKRKMTRSQIDKLSKRFKVSPAIFFDHRCDHTDRD